MKPKKWSYRLLNSTNRISYFRTWSGARKSFDRQVKAGEQVCIIYDSHGECILNMNSMK